MVVVCEKCQQGFKSQAYLDKHSKNTIPCDLFCNGCHRYYKSRTGYKAHLENNECKSLVVDSIEEYRKTHPSKKEVNVNGGNNVIGDNNIVYIYSPTIVNNPFKDPDESYVSEVGILPHGSEEKLLLKENIRSLHSLMMKFLEKHPKKKYAEQSLKILILEIVKMFYQNPSTPQYINIFSDGPKSNHNKVYSGSKFVEDEMTKSIRNCRILQIILSTVEGVATYENVHPLVSKFINTTLLPHILQSYFTDAYQADLQQIWEENKKILKKHKKKWTQRPYPFDSINFDKQFKSLKADNMKIHSMNFRASQEKFEKQFKDSQNKRMVESFRAAQKSKEQKDKQMIDEFKKAMAAVPHLPKKKHISLHEMGLPSSRE